jgi:hypothetical protein
MKKKELYINTNNDLSEKPQIGLKSRSSGTKYPQPDSAINSSKPKFPEKIIKETAKKKKKRGRKILVGFFSIVFLIVLVVGGLAIYFVVLPARRVSQSIDNIKSNLISLAQDFQSKDLSNIDQYFSNIRLEFDNIDSEIDRYEFLSTSEYTKGYYDNFQTGRGMLNKTSDLFDETLPELKSILEVTGFKTVENEEVSEEDEGSITLVLKELPRYLALYDSIEPKLIDILDDAKNFDLNYIPEVGDYELKEKITSLNEFVEDFPQTSDQVTDFLQYLPELAGAVDPASYLLILQNETEMRSSGGLLTAYGNATIHEGEFGDDIFLTDMWNLEIYVSYTLGIDTGYRNIYGQNVMMNLGCGSTYLRAQDAGIYPDLYWTMDTLQDYYNIANRYNKTDFPNYDYILIINNKFAENLLSLIQPLEIEGFGEVTAENLYDSIKSETDKPTTFDPNRKDIIKDIANAAKQKFLDLPIEKLPEVINVLIKSFQAKDLGIATPNDKDIQAYLDTYGMSGRTVKEYTGDYFQLNEAQNCSLKLNKFIRNTVKNDVYIEDTGEIKRNVQVKWQQPKVFEPGLEKQYSPTLSFSYRAWVRFFTPADSSDFESDGYKRSGYVGYFPQTYYDKVMDKEVNDNIIQFDHRRFNESDPVEKDEMNVSYVLPDSINYTKDKKYTLIIQKHPGKSWGEENKVIVHHKGNQYTIDFVLDRDKILTYKDGVMSVDNYDKSLDWIPTLVEGLPWESLKSE